MRKALGGVPTIVLIIVPVVLVIGIVVGLKFWLIKPQEEELATLKDNLQKEKDVAAKKEEAEQTLAEVTEEWKAAQEELQQLKDEKSFEISMYQPVGAMIAMWYEYRHDLPQVTEDWIDSTAVELNSSISFPTPSMEPPSVPSTGFMELPQNISLSISGSLEEIDDFYHSLDNYPRIATIGALDLSGEGQDLTANFPLTVYLLIETPSRAAPGAGGAQAGMGMEPGMMEPGMEGPMGPGMEGPPGPGMEPGMEGPPGPGMEPGMEGPPAP